MVESNSDGRDQSTAKVAPNILIYMCKLPTEIIQQIVRDLTVGQILKLCCYDYYSFDEIILSDPILKKLFPTKEALETLKTYYRLHKGIFSVKERIGDGRKVLSAKLKETASTAKAQTSHEIYTVQLCQAFHRILFNKLEETQDYFSVLSTYSKQPLGRTGLSGTVEDLKRRWENVMEAQQNLNAIKEAQILRLVRLMEEYPGTLRAILDPSQRPRREQHIVSNLRVFAGQVNRSNFILRQMPAKCLFYFDSPPFVPYKRHILLFLDVVHRFPVAQDSELGAEVSQFRVLLRDAGADGGSGQPVKPRPYPYPAEIGFCIEKALEGLPDFYTKLPRSTGSPEVYSLIENRTRTEPSKTADEVHATSGSRQRVPRHKGAKKGLKRLLGQDAFPRNYTYGLWPQMPSDLEWLTCFLKACAFMSTLHEINWDEKRTVGEMWQDRIEFHEKAAADAEY